MQTVKEQDEREAKREKEMREYMDKQLAVQKESATKQQDALLAQLKKMIVLYVLVVTQD